MTHLVRRPAVRPGLLAAPLSRRSFLSRSAFVGAGLMLPVGGLLSACGSSDDSAGTGSGEGDPVSLQLSYLPSVEYSGYYQALDAGYYADSDIDGTFIDGGPSVAVEATVAAGSALVGIDTADVIMSARQNGAPLVMFGAQFQKNPLGVVSLASAPFTDPKSLEGSRLGVPTSLEAAVDQFLAANDVDKSTITYIPYQGDAGPLISEDIDAGVTFTTATVPLLDAAGVQTSDFLFADYGYAVYNNCPFTTEQVLAEQPEILARWLRATIRGWQDALADPSRGVDLVVNDYGKSQGLTRESQESQAAAQAPLMVSDTTEAHGLFFMDDAGIAANLATITTLGIDADPMAFDTTVLAAAYDGATTIDGP